MKKILICSSTGNPHILKELKVIHDLSDDIQIDFLSLSYVKDKDASDLRPFIEQDYIIRESNIKSVILKKLYQLWGILKIWYRLRDAYDCVIINAITDKYLLIFKKLRRSTKTLVLCPWGSEILRASKISLNLLKRLYNQSDYVLSVSHSRFETDLKKLLGVDETKLVSIPNGSKLIDLHISNKMSKKDAKESFNLSGKFVITCGYNGYRTQNHISIINELSKETSQLPDNLHLVFPMTYGLTNDYKLELEKNLKEKGVEYTLLTNFLSTEQLFLLQRATDIFIHLQKTDASSASVREYIMAGATVFNGSWLSYPEIELHGIPYIKVDSYGNLAHMIELYLKREIYPCLSEDVYNDIKQFSYDNYIKNWEKAINNWIP